MAEVKADNKKTKANKPWKDDKPFFTKENYRLMLIGLVLISLGIILMLGGKSKDPNVFDPDEVYSFRRITVAPILILAGFVVEIFAIFKKPKDQQAQ
jgi:uncharacterized membrane protein